MPPKKEVWRSDDGKNRGGDEGLHGVAEGKRGAEVGGLCWLGFAAATSYATAMFSMQPKGLWLIKTGYNLVAFVLAGAILAAWL